MQNSTITTTVQRTEVEVSADWAAEAEALAQRVNRKLGQPTPIVPQRVAETDYEPQGLDGRGEAPTRRRTH